MTKSEAAKLRAKVYLARYGKDYFKKIGSNGGTKKDTQKAMATNKRLYGDDFYLKLAEKGRMVSKEKRANGSKRSNKA